MSDVLVTLAVIVQLASFGLLFWVIRSSHRANRPKLPQDGPK